MPKQVDRCLQVGYFLYTSTLKPNMITRNVSRGEYESAKADFIAAVRSRMAARNLTPAAVAAASLQRVLNGATATAITAVNLNHYLSGVALPTPPKLAELAAVLDCSPTDLLRKELQQRRRVKRRHHAHIPDAFTVRVDPGPTADTSTLVVNATLPSEQAYGFAKVLTRKLSDLKALRDVPGMTQVELEEHQAAAQARAEMNG